MADALLRWLVGYPLIALLCLIALCPQAIRPKLDKLLMSREAFEKKYWQSFQ